MRIKSRTTQTLGQDLFQGLLAFILIVCILFIALGIVGAALGQETEPQGMWEVENVKESSQLGYYHSVFV